MYNNLRKYIGNKDIIINTNIKIIDNKQLKNIKINCINLLHEEDLGDYVQ